MRIAPPLALLCALLAVPSAARAASSSPDSLTWILDRWTNAVGGAAPLERLAGVHLRERTNRGGVPGTAETWLTRDGQRTVYAEDDDRSERVCTPAACWDRDWNGKTLALERRDLADARTEAFVRALVYAGRLRGAGTQDGGDDSTHAFRIVHFDPEGAAPCDVYVDRAGGRPARATWRRYDDTVTLAFDDWRDVAGVSMPFRTTQSTNRGNADTSFVLEATPIAPGKAPAFQRPLDGPTDVSFAAGDSATGIPFTFDTEHVMLECSVNGGKPTWFLFDTGADVSIINRPRLAELGLTGFGAAKSGGGGGPADFEFTHVARFDMGGLTLRNQRLGVLDLSGLERLYGVRMGGILGYDFASRFMIVVDYGARTMSLYGPRARRPAPRGTRVPFVLEQGHPHAAGAIVVDDGPAIATDFVIDSGAAETANLTAPFVRANRLLERARKAPAAAPNVTPGGEKQWFTQTSVRGKLRELRVAAVAASDVPVNLQQGTSGAYASASFSGTVGQHFLRRYTNTYDYEGRALWLEPNAEAKTPFAPRTTFGVSLVADGADYTVFTVAAIRKDSPAEAAGFRKGDVISSLDGVPAAKLRLADVRAAFAADGSSHTVEVVREKSPSTIPFTVKLVSIED